MVTRIDVDRLLTLVADGAPLVDVLPPATYASEHLPNATNVPFATFDPEDLADFDRRSPIVLYCFDQH